MKKTSTVVIALALTMLAFGALGVASASANYFKSGVLPENWKGVNVGAQTMYLGAENSPFSCKAADFVGVTESVYKAESLTVSPELGECNHGPVHSWTMHGCRYRFFAGGSVDIVDCESAMVWHPVEEACEIRIGNQKALGTLEYSNVTVGGIPSVKIVAKIKGITYTRERCAEHEEGLQHDGTYQGEWTVTGTSWGGVASPVEFEWTKPHQFLVAEAPATISGVRTSPTQETVLEAAGGGSLNCKVQELHGTMSSVSAETITLTPTYKECSDGGVPIPDSAIKAGGCSYTLHANGETVDIAGSTCGTNPITIERPGCTSTFGPQSGFPTFTYENSGGLVVKGSTPTEPREVTSTTSGAGCSKSGTFQTGRVVIHQTHLVATNSKGEVESLTFE